MSVAEILGTHPLPLMTDVGALAACIDECAECERHAHKHEHCRLSADECRRCAARCDELLAALRPGLTQGSS